MTLAATGPNAQQIEYWNEQSGPKWVALESLLDQQIGPLGLATIERAKLAARDRVLDIGCGCGQSSLQLGERVAPGGSVLGIDVSTTMLERARARARELGMDHVRFENADAQTFAFAPGAFDLAFSRFGVMFFADPVSAFANVRTAVAPGGRLAFLCWQEIRRNRWMLVPLMAAAQHVPLPEPPAPGAPGPFSLADTARLHEILGQAGWADVVCEPLEGELSLGGRVDLERAVDFALRIGPVGAALREAGEAALPAITASVREALKPYATPEGVRLGYAAWIVSAVAAG